MRPQKGKKNINYLSEDNTVKSTAIYLFICIVSFYLISISWPNVHFVDQYFLRYEVTKSIVERWDLSIPDGYNGIRGVDGRTYSMYGLGWSALAVPFYIVGDFLGRGQENVVSVMNPVIGGATVTLVFLFSIALGYSKRVSLAVAFFYGMGTMAWPLAKQPFDHVVETFLILLSLYSLYIHISRKKISHLVMSAVSIGIALNTRLTASLVLPAMFILMAIGCFTNGLQKSSLRRFLKNMAVFLIVLLPFAGIIMWYNYHRFGSFFETGFQLFSTRTGLDFFSGTPFLIGMKGFLTSPGKGFFYYSPIAIFFFLAIISFYKKHPGIAVAFILIISSYLLFHSNLFYWHGDWAWGPRYLLAITPFFILPIAELLDSDRWIKKRSLVILPIYVVPIYVVFALSIGIQIAAVSVHFNNYFYHLQIDQNVRFSLVNESGLPGVSGPPPEVYFDWTKSPILAQFKYIKKMGSQINQYRFVEIPRNGTDREKVKAYPSMHIFDFWWVYMYYISRSHAGFVGILVLLIVVGICGIRMGKLSRRSSFQEEGSG
jgi:hypothetical protein